MEQLKFKIALNLIPNIGPRMVRRLVSYAGSTEAVFREKKQTLEKIPGIGSVKAASVKADNILAEAEKEIEFIRKQGIHVLFYLDDSYPLRLKECEDSPVILYSKGMIDLNAPRIISIVGTRKASEYGKSVTSEIIAWLASRYPDLVVVSGLAYGIDITAHKEALRNNLKTIAVLGHGFQFIYPAHHKYLSGKIIRDGALVTEFQGKCKPEPGNFVSRNRIIAGLADATLVIESALKGGALITADIAVSYNRDVLAVPGRGSDNYSRGCNMLIKTNKAALVENGTDVENALGWYVKKKSSIAVQQELFTELTSEEKKILEYLTLHGESALDHISLSLDIPVPKLSARLLNLEFCGLVKPLPGKYFRKN
jgi:DNA processing protein